MSFSSHGSGLWRTVSFVGFCRFGGADSVDSKPTVDLSVLAGYKDGNYFGTEWAVNKDEDTTGLDHSLYDKLVVLARSDISDPTTVTDAPDQEVDPTTEVLEKDPIPVATEPSDDDDSDGNSLSGGAIAGIVVGIIAVIAIIVIVIFVLKKSGKHESSTDAEPVYEEVAQ